VKSFAKPFGFWRNTTPLVPHNWAEFNGQVGRRLASLDRGEALDPAKARARLRRKIRRAPEAACVSDYILSVDAVLDLDNIDAADHWIEKLFDPFEALD
jgi:hypothetical protein